MPRKPDQVEYGYKHLEPGHPDNLKPYRVCGSKTRSEDAVSTVCQKHAGWGTDHVGVGRCRIHGGRNRQGMENSQFKTGRYAHIWKGRLKEHIGQIASDDSNPLDLLPELEVSRVVLSIALDRIAGSPEQPMPSLAVQETKQTGHDSVSDSVSVNHSSNSQHGGATTFTDQGYPADIPRSEKSSTGTPGGLATQSMRMVSIDDINLVRECTNDVINAATKMIAARNQTALTKAEVTYILMIMKEAIGRFVPKENREAFIKYLVERVPVIEQPEIPEIAEIV